MQTMVFLIGLVVGSFLNVLIDRLPHGEDVIKGRSCCDHCKKILRWFELIPLFSFIYLGGRCLRCHKRLSIQYPLVELVTAIGYVYLSFPSQSLHLLVSQYLLFSSFLVMFVSDLKYMIIPDSMVVVGILGVLLQGHPLQIPQGVAFWISGLGAALFFCVLYLITRGRGMGLGDVKLAFLLGFLLGFPKIIVGLYAAFLTGAIVGVILMVKGKKSFKSRIAFGPFLIMGTALAYVFGDMIIAMWYSFV